MVVRLPGIIVGIVLYYTLRKRHELELQKTLIRGDNGLWYLIDADLQR